MIGMKGETKIKKHVTIGSHVSNKAKNRTDHERKKISRNTKSGIFRIVTQFSEHHFKTITRMRKYKTCPLFYECIGCVRKWFDAVTTTLRTPYGSDS